MQQCYAVYEINDFIGYSINILNNEPRGLRDLHPLGNHIHTCISILALWLRVEVLIYVSVGVY